MVTIERLVQAQIESLKKVKLAEEQVKFAGTAEDFLQDGSEATHLHVIKLDGEIVGFFKLDTAYSYNYEFCPATGLGLRAFALDKDQQGKGVGTRTVKALFPYLKEHYTSFEFIYLTVNLKNPGAIACYEKGGFEKTDELYLGGAAGPQHIMRGRL
jgi:GNAT superfamily N-acetyltransferase